MARLTINHDTLERLRNEQPWGVFAEQLCPTPCRDGSGDRDGVRRWGLVPMADPATLLGVLPTVGACDVAVRVPDDDEVVAGRFVASVDAANVVDEGGRSRFGCAAGALLGAGVNCHAASLACACAIPVVARQQFGPSRQHAKKKAPTSA